MPPVSPASRSGALVTWLVVFVLLWVVATVFAIYYYVDGTKAQESLTKLTDQYKEVIPASELSGDEIQNLRTKKQSDTTGKYNQDMALFDVLRTERDELATAIGAQQPDQATQTVQTTLANATAQAKTANVPNLPPTLSGAIQTLTQALVARQNEVASLNQQLKQAQEAATQAAANMQKNQEELTKAMAAARGEAQQASATLESDRAAKDDQIKKMIADNEAAQKQSQDQPAQAQASISDLTKKLEASQRILDDLRNKLGLKRANTADSVVRQADGTIVRVPGNGTVYINLGTGDQISPGLTFEVYDRAEGIPPVGDASTDDNLPTGKGSIEVVRVGAGSSECRIVKQQAGQVIHEGDLIANLVYDRNTKYQFFIYGDFDLDQNGVSTPQDADVIKRLVTQWGGKVTDKVNADTDFVVLGKEPTVIIPSKEEATDP